MNESIQTKRTGLVRCPFMVLGQICRKVKIFIRS